MANVENYVFLSKRLGNPVSEQALLFNHSLKLIREYLELIQENSILNKVNLNVCLKKIEISFEKVSFFSTKDKRWHYHVCVVSNAVGALKWFKHPDPVELIRNCRYSCTLYINKILNEYKDKLPIHYEWIDSIKKFLDGLEKFVSLELPFFDISTSSGVKSKGSILDKRILTSSKNNSCTELGKLNIEVQQKTDSSGKIENVPYYEHLKGSKYIFEYFKSDKSLKVANSSTEENINLFQCDDCSIEVGGKCNNVIISNCKKTSVLVNIVISCIDISNCESCQLQVLGRASTISLDNVNSCQIYLSEKSLQVEIITSRVTNLNVNVPELANLHVDDIKEHSIPEQFKTIWDPSAKKFLTECLNRF